MLDWVRILSMSGDVIRMEDSFCRIVPSHRAPVGTVIAEFGSESIRFLKSTMSREYRIICLDCGKPARTKGSHSTRCKLCQRIRDNQRAAARMAKKRKDDSEWREADRARSRELMRRLRGDGGLTRSKPRSGAKKRQKNRAREVN
jgi:hypothetical protein